MKYTPKFLLGQFGSVDLLNQNFTDVSNELQNKVLYRNNPDGEPNAMQNSLDMNSNRILNLPDSIKGTRDPVLRTELDSLTSTGSIGALVAKDTVSKMIIDTSLGEGDFVQTAGYFSPGDEGGNVYLIVSENTGQDDGGSFITLDNNFQAKGLFLSGSNPLQFGADPNDNGDNTSQFQAWFDFESEKTNDTFNSPMLYIPPGTYRFDSKAIYKVAESGVSNVGTDGVSLLGDGTNACYLVANPSNTEGIIEFTSDKNSELWRVSGISFLSDLNKDASSNNGIGLDINSTLGRDDAGFGFQPRRTVRVTNCYFGGYGTGTGDRAFRGNFFTSLLIQNKWWPFIQDVYVRGSDIPFDSDTNDPLYTLTGRENAIKFKNSYSPEIINTQVTGYYIKGLLIEGRDESIGGEDIEDFRVTNCFFVNQETGISYLHSEDQSGRNLYEPGGAIIGNHVAALGDQIHIRYHRQVVISGNYIYVSRGNGLTDFIGNPAGVFLEGADDITLANNQFLEPGFFIDQDNAAVGVRANNKVTAHITGTLFNHGGVGISVDSNTSGNIVLSDSAVIGARSSEWASFTRTIDRSSILAEISVNNIPSQDKSTFEIKNNYSGAGPGPRINIFSDRTDFSTNSNPEIGLLRFSGRTSTGNREEAITMVAKYVDNTDGADDTELTVFQRRNGILTPAFNVNEQGRFSAEGFASQGKFGSTTSFTNGDGNTVTVTRGLITDIS